MWRPGDPTKRDSAGDNSWETVGGSRDRGPRGGDREEARGERGSRSSSGGVGRMGSADSSNWRRGPPRDTEPTSSYRREGERERGFGLGGGGNRRDVRDRDRDRGGNRRGDQFGASDGKGGFSTDTFGDAPAWADEPAADPSKGSLGMFAADGSFMAESGAGGGGLLDGLGGLGDALEPLSSGMTGDASQNSAFASKLGAMLGVGDGGGGGDGGASNSSRPAWAQSLSSDAGNQSAPQPSSSAVSDPWGTGQAQPGNALPADDQGASLLGSFDTLLMDTPEPPHSPPLQEQAKEQAEAVQETTQWECFVTVCPWFYLW